MILVFVVLGLLTAPSFSAPVAKTRNGNLYGIQLPEAQAFFRYCESIRGLTLKRGNALVTANLVMFLV